MIDFISRLQNFTLTQEEWCKFISINNISTQMKTSYQNVNPRTIAKNLSLGRDSAKDESRAAGIWIWDKVQELGRRHGNLKEAIKTFEDTYPIIGEGDKYFGGDSRSNYELAARCIEAATFLPTTRESRSHKRKPE